jgi:hypothetical protein
MTVRAPFGQVFRELNWPRLLLIGLVGGVLWTILLSQNNTLTFFAGLLPVAGGIWLGRTVTSHVGWHAALLSLITVLAALVTVGLLWVGGGDRATILSQVSVGLIMLLPFPAFGVFTAHRSEQRSREVRMQQQRRGGRLERPGRVKSIEELRSLSLPQLGSYVADLFRKHDFKVQDYRFDRDNYIEFEMIHDEALWLVRVTVEEKVKQGVALQFFQRLRADDNSPKGVLITSMDFQDAALRWAKDKPIALIDGPTLLSMND